MNRHRRGFTLIELLVVIAIIGILVSLLLPAVQAARESGRRAQCSNHLKQLSLGCQAHNDAYKVLPSAGGPNWNTHMTYNNGTPAIAPDQRGGWGFQILPFIEQQNVWQGGSATTDIDRSVFAIGFKIPTLFCPSRRAPEAPLWPDWYNYLQYPTSNPHNGVSSPHAKNDYAAVSHSAASPGFDQGVGPIIRTWTEQYVRTQAISFVNVTDGLSNTMILGEKAYNRAGLGGMPGNDNEGYTAGWNHDTSRHTSLLPIADYFDGNILNLRGDPFGGPHPGIVQMTFCDGSVRPITLTIDLPIWSSLGHRGDGKTVSIP